MAFSKKKNKQFGSAQVGDWRFTYQDRIGSFKDVGLAGGDAALGSYARLFGEIQR